MDIPQLHELARRFLYDHIYPDSALSSNEIPLEDCPIIHSKISVFHSAVATFFAPSDESGIHGMRREWIRSTPSWRGKHQRRDCALIVEDDNQPGFRGMSVVRVHLFFSFKHSGRTIPCALIRWFKRRGQRPDPSTGLWVVYPETHGRRQEPLYSVVHLDTMLRAAHLIPVFGMDTVPVELDHTFTLDIYQSFYLNKYIDHHACELLSV